MKITNVPFIVTSALAFCGFVSCTDIEISDSEVATPVKRISQAEPKHLVKPPQHCKPIQPCRSFYNEERIILEAAKCREIGPLLHPELPKCTDLVILGPHCKGILPHCLKVLSRDYLKTGAAIRAYRRASRRCEACPVVLCEPKVICTKQSRCSNLSLERFIEAVLETARIVSCGKVRCFSRFAREIIERIYIAGCKNNASCEQLIIFTATAMHNLYLFNCFPCPSESRAIGFITRGLMQWLSEQGYTNLSNVSAINYLATPNMLDLYTAETIQNEFTAYLRFYNNDHLFGVNAFIYTVKAFNSKEAGLVNLRSAELVLRREYNPTNVLEERVLRRFQLYYTLNAKVFDNWRECYRERRVFERSEN